MQNKKKIYLVDGYNFIYRLFYAIPQFSLKDGTPINTVFGMAKIILGWHHEDKPDYLIFTLDYKGKTIREQIYSDYKGTRDKMPTDLKIQEKLIMELLEKFGIKTVSLEGYEADDIIGTLALRLKKDTSNEVFILSGDKDLYQFIDTNVAIYDTMKRKIFHKEEAIEKFGVEPGHVVDYLAICGDSSDNIPGIPGFGPKKAQELINKYGNLEKIYESIEEIIGKTKEVLENNREVAFLSKQLASIYSDLELADFNLEDHNFTKKEILNPEVIDIFKRFEFKSLIPSHHQEKIKNFDTLGLKITKIKNSTELDELLKKVKKSGKVAISTIGNGTFELNGINLYLGEKIIYFVDSRELEIKDFLNNLLNCDIEIIGFELKSDLKRIYGYLENMGTKEIRSEIQASLF
ncbi:MAG: 5'-3' exonuclease H3TH domain-containing protein [Candidatus Gracilibacteria bacterium]|nr:5'-3' exonuclease H3TH domain-containing protein [Candidatus Gracilibacteria bacterium]MDD2908468.1 5'-3' exonuclease H3TH domain-containing protein [Candidatus Gracilibacteria bacterium]